MVEAESVLTFKKRLDACNEWDILSRSFQARHQQVTSKVTFVEKKQEGAFPVVVQELLPKSLTKLNTDVDLR